jgi:hypothetical protein
VQFDLASPRFPKSSARAPARALFIAFAAAACAFGKDPNQPIPTHALEVGVGYGLAAIPGAYDSSGAYHKFPGGFLPLLHGAPLSLKYGVGGGLDFKAEWSALFSNEDAGLLAGRSGPLRGMSQPKLGLRYLAWKPGGVYANLTLPFATGNLDNGNLSTLAEVGGLLRHKWENARVTALASVSDDFDKVHSLRLMTKGDLIRKAFTGSGSVDFAKARDRDAWLLLLGPTLRFDLSKAQAFDAAATFTVAGHNAPAGWTVRASSYHTFGQ